MNPKDQNTEIALLCGWKHDKPKSDCFMLNPQRTLTCPPNYVGDLNGMAEAYRTLSIEEIQRCHNELAMIVIPKGRHILESTAAERAEAFLKVKGKWREGV